MAGERRRKKSPAASFYALARRAALAWICHPTYHPKPARTVLCWHNIASAAAARGQPAAGPGLSQRGRRGGGAARPTCTRARSRPMERHAPTRRHLCRAPVPAARAVSVGTRQRHGTARCWLARRRRRSSVACITSMLASVLYGTVCHTASLRLDNNRCRV